MLLAAVALIGMIAFRRRPVRGPDPEGDWRPDER